MVDITIDFETRSTCNLLKAGPYIYSTDPSTSIMCLAWKYADDPVEEVFLWAPASPAMEERGAKELTYLHEAIGKGFIVEAHNAFFERSIWANVGVFLGWPDLELRQLRCSAAKAASFSLPRKLELAIAALGLPFPKDMEGHKLMLKMCKPRTPRKAELEKVGLRKTPTGIAKFLELYGPLWHEKPEQMERLYEYCKQDVRAEHALSESLRDLSPMEQEVWFLDQEINWRGLHLDIPGVKKALGLATQIREKATKDMDNLTSGAVPTCSARPSFQRWLNAAGVAIPDTQKDTIVEWLKRDDVPGHVHKALEIWANVNRTSTKKYDAMLLRAAICDQRARDILKYWGANTGRWAGVGIQPQNFPRGTIKDMDGLWEDIHALSLAEMDEKYGDTMEALASSLRGAITAPPGKELISADYASIEARGLFWVAGDERALSVMRSGHVIYKDMAGAILNALGKPMADPQSMPKSDPNYTLGKQAILGLGYQMGGPKFRETCAGYGLHITEEFAKEIVDLYRSTYPEVKRLWTAMEVAAIEAVERGPRAADPVICKNTAWAQRGRFLHCKLPGGRLLSYCDPRIVHGVTPWGTPSKKLEFMGVDSYTHKWVRQKTYGGKLCLAKGTLVLEQQRGPTPIEQIVFADRVWDGVEWVYCDGAVLNGYKSTIDVRGVQMTPDHLVLTKEAGWLSAKEIAGSKWWSSPVSATAVGRYLEKLNQRTRTAKAEPASEQNGKSKFDATAEQRLFGVCGHCGKGHLLTASGALAKNARARTVGERCARIMRSVINLCGRFLRPSRGVTTRKTKPGRTMGPVESKYGERGERNEFFSSNTFCCCPDTITSNSHSTGSTMIGGTSPETCDSQQNHSKRRIAVYDILNAGPRSRFTVLGQEPLIVHNCENVVQALSRDLMAEAMLRCSGEGYTPILTVHDEIVAEQEIGAHTVEEFEKMMSRLPDWAEGCPVEAEGWIAQRYHK